MLQPLLGAKSFRQQNLLFGCGLLVALVLIFRFSIQRTFGLRHRAAALEQQAAAVAQAPDEIKVLESNLESLESTALQNYDRAVLLEQLSSFCREHGLLIRNFPQERLVRSNEFNVVTNQIEVEGDFAAIVELAYLLEREKRLGNINSMSFFRYEDRYEKTIALRCRIVLRNITQ